MTGLHGMDVVGYSLLGTLLGALLCLIPSLHIYNVMGLALVVWLEVRTLIPYHAIAPFFMSMMVTFSFINTVPMTFLSAADESAGASILPSVDMVMNGRGRDAAILTGMGVWFGSLILIVLTPFYYFVWKHVSVIVHAHLHWILGLVMLFYIVSEWPKGAGRGKNGWEKTKDGWRNLIAGIVTFALSAIVGLIITTKPLAPPDKSFQNIMPVFLGFFAFPGIVQTFLSDFRLPPQYKSPIVNAGWSDFPAASFSGVAGGLMAMSIPGVTAGIAAVFASHLTNHRAIQNATFEEPIEEGTVVHLHTPEIYYQQERLFMIAGGITKVMYYVGAFLLLFVLTDITPNGMGRGGLNVLLKPMFTPEHGDYFVAAATILFSASVSMLLLIWFTDLAIWLVPKLNVRAVYIAVTAMLLVILYTMGGGPAALGVAAVTTLIGCIPVFFNCRRSHCMAVLLVPIALNAAGYQEPVMRLLRLT